jgi:hypothetical protein
MVVEGHVIESDGKTDSYATAGRDARIDWKAPS